MAFTVLAGEVAHAIDRVGKNDPTLEGGNETDGGSQR
jgi:hypothetical protein